MQEQYFNGIRFTIGPGRKYFSNSAIRPKSMHQYVWSYYNGPVPKGYDVHHIDGNRYNNDITNLQLLKREEHRKIHSKMLTEEEREWRRNNFNTKARPKAIEWHKSEAGKAWHKEHAKKMAIRNRVDVRCICQQCGKEFITTNINGLTRKFCSGACSQKYRRDNGLNAIERTCAVCGKTFIADRYGKTQTCGKSCARKYGNILKQEGN